MFDSLRRIVPQYVRRSYALKFAISLLVLGLVVMGIGIVATEAVRGGVEENTLTQHEAAAQAEADAFENIHRKNKEYVNMAIETKLIREYEAGDEQQAATIDQYFSDWKPNLPTYMQNLHFVRTDDQSNYTTFDCTIGSSSDSVTLDQQQGSTATTFWQYNEIPDYVHVQCGGKDTADTHTFLDIRMENGAYVSDKGYGVNGVSKS